jgi:pheromone shutdown protein TraB
MKRIDVKHIAYHVLVGVYFVWLLVFGALIAMALLHALGNGNRELSKILMMWMFFNLVMGTVLFIVIRLFRTNNILSRIILYTYCLMAIAAITSVLIISVQ